MPGRSFLFVGLLTLAVALPYVLSKDGLRGRAAAEPEGEVGDPYFADDNGDIRGGAYSETALVAAQADTPPARPFWKKWFAASENASSVPSAAATTSLATNRDALDGLPGRPVEARGLGGPAGLSLADALRFDISPAWVTQNWARVTTQLSELDLNGIRVPIVSGTAPHDVAGSLTYYFDAQQAVRRIRMSGVTCDPEPLSALVQQRFGMKQYASASAGLFLAYQKDLPIGMLRLEQPVVQDVSRGTKYRVELELNAPRADAILSPATLSRMHELRKSNML